MKHLLAILSIVVAFTATASGKTMNPLDSLQYDIGKGWWWYEETYQDPETKEQKKVKIKLTPKEKLELDAKNKTNELLAKNLKVNEQILSRLEYAFPNVTPLKTVNKKTGKECVTNSSMDCFVMPVVAEGQQIPVLKEFLREPSPSKSKEWLKWQATYFNHVQKVSHGLRFAYLKYGAEAYPTTTSYALGDSLTLSNAEKTLAHRQAKIIHSMKDRIALVAFVGKNTLYEKSNKIGYQIHNWNKSFLKDIDKRFVFESQKSANEFMKHIHKTYYHTDRDAYKFWQNAEIAIRPDLFKEYKVRITPSIVMFYEDKKTKKNMWQTILSGSLASGNVRRQMMNFLTYNGIVEEKSMGADVNWNSPQIGLSPKVPKPISKDIYKDYLKK